MKISEMIRREDFYTINQRTLASYFGKSYNVRKLYIYPYLNIIITKHPSKFVKSYVYTEYRINGPILRRILVQFYVMLAINSGGIMATQTVLVPYERFNNDMMIYPCNKRYRIFNFSSDVVDVIAKDGFPCEPIHREIIFRKKQRLSFMLPILEEFVMGYRERIIHGTPLARLRNKEYVQKRDEAWKTWSEYVARTIHLECIGNYIDILMARIEQNIQPLRRDKPNVKTYLLFECAKRLISLIKPYDKETIQVGLSHGDFHPGNIWIENRTGRIYIIDWESSGERSVWYDYAALYEGLRDVNGPINIFKASRLRRLHSYGLMMPIWSRYIVIFEELLFRIDELFDFPDEMGTDNFNKFLSSLLISI